MKHNVVIILSYLLTSAILGACGSRQTDRDAQATQIAAEIFATQTAQAPTPTHTLLPTPTFTATPTETLTPTPSPTSTRTQAATPTVTQFPTSMATSTAQREPTSEAIPTTFRFTIGGTE